MFRFLLKRLALTLPTFFALMFVTFVMICLVPGDPIEVRRGERGRSDRHPQRDVSDAPDHRSFTDQNMPAFLMRSVKAE